MNKIIKLSLTLGAFLPLIVNGASELDTILVQEQEETKQEYKQNSFYKSYSSELITKKDIEEKSVINLKDALKDVSNIKVKDMGSFSKSLSIRGFKGERVVSIVDGAKISNHGMTMSGGGELSLIESSSVEQMEVVKGSPSILYDPGAVGGVIKIKTIKDIDNIKDKIRIKHTYLNNQGYKLNKNITTLEGKYDKFYIQYIMSNEKSEGRAVKDQEKLKYTLHKTNSREERYGTEHELKDLSYKSKANNLTLGYKIYDKINFLYKNFDKKSEDITETYGSRTPMAFHYDEYNMDGSVVGIDIKDIYGFNRINILNNKQIIYKMSHGKANTKNETQLTSNTKKVDLEYPLDDLLILSGIEQTKDKARTYTFSRQTYDAIYLSGEYIYEDFTLTAGIRNNKHWIQKDLKSGERVDICQDKVGISGCPPPKNDEKINYSAGVVYSINDFNNISFNYATTYRYPSLYERFAYNGGFIGGGMDMKPEEADNFDISWKYLNDESGLNIKVTIFKSDFDTYNDTVESISIQDQNALDECNEDVNCNPFDDDVNEEKIFAKKLKYTSIKDVKSSGFEIDIEKEFKKQNIITTFNIAQTTISDKKIIYDSGYVYKEVALQEPLEYSTSIKKNFKYYYKPWIKLNLRHVTNNPKVKQKDGFEAFTVGNLYFGAKKGKFTLNAGVKNITDKVYNEPYSPLDGVERSFFFSISIELEKLL